MLSLAHAAATVGREGLGQGCSRVVQGSYSLGLHPVDQVPAGKALAGHLVLPSTFTCFQLSAVRRSGSAVYATRKTHPEQRWRKPRERKWALEIATKRFPEAKEPVNSNLCLIEQQTIAVFVTGRTHDSKTLCML